MKPRSSYKIRRTGRPFDDYLDGVIRAQRRADRIVESLRSDIVEGGAGQSLRIRRVFQNPREIYRIELEVPEMSYQRTTLLDRDALEDLLEADEVRAILVGEAG